MTVTTTPIATPQAVRPRSTRLLWPALALVVGGTLGAGVALAIDDGPSRPARAGDAAPDAATAASARSAAGHPVSPDAIDRAAIHRQQAAAVEGCTELVTSADAADRCLAGVE